MPSKDQIASLKKEMTAYCEAHHIFGALRITHHGRTTLEAAFGYADLEAKRPFSEDSLFSLYSISKTFCTLGLLKLSDAGRVDIDSHPARYVPEAQGLDGRVTIRHMLHHTSGLPDFGQNKEFADAHRPGTPDRIRAHLCELKHYPQYFAPGTATMYANINMILPALIIENVSGLSYADYMKKEVFSPLGAKSILVDHEGLTQSNRVTGYELSEDEATASPTKRCLDWMMGAGDLLGTVDDVYALFRAIQGRLLLKESTWKEVLTSAPINTFGMGCRLEPWHEKKCITHTGGHVGFRTLQKILPDEDFDLILLSNSGFGTARADLSEMIFSAFFKEDSQRENREIEMDKGYI